jgi:hypothetical protein
MVGYGTFFESLCGDDYMILSKKFTEELTKKLETENILFNFLSKERNNKMEPTGWNNWFNITTTYPVKSGTATISVTTEKEEFEKNLGKFLTPKRIVYSNRATVVFWRDGTKTVARCSDGDEFSEDAGFRAALAKRIFGNFERYQKFIKRAEHQAPKVESVVSCVKEKKSK